MSSEGSGTAIRRMVEADLESVDRIYNHFVETTAVSFDLAPMPPAARRGWFEQFDEHGPHQALVAELAGRVVGYVCSHELRAKPAYATSVETTIYVDPERLGQGIGLLLYRALFTALRSEDLHRAFAGIALPNDRSVALHRKVGFREVGTWSDAGRKFGRYWDLLWMERILP